ncbi:InlB B-repeat-containing protein [Treponema parvum]|uniref:InlB B-repeat-containing protein n=1 Tax=Treponema parvum TaxID=138851 RepID=A0A975IEY4_9SPIR|nr:InlB B-repeat-containing protein [Treponema parvum]QTQ14368.1 InlB B-repeat-containing protein [Treponema parvum]
MRKIITVIIGAASIALLLSVTACKELFADIEEDFSYWASEPIITNFRAASPASVSAAGVQCVPSSHNAVLTLTVHNPRNFSFVMPGSSGAPSDIVTFASNVHDASGINPPEAGADYTLVQSGQNTLTLTYESVFLKRYEWSSANIGASIRLYSTDGRKFNQIYKFNLEANTPPPKPTAVLAKTTTSPENYVLCLQVPDMGISVPGGKLHEDIAEIEINGTSYTLTVSGGDFVKPADAHFITAVTQLAGYPSPPSGAWVLYYDTGLAVGNAYQPYTVKLKDRKGLVSETLETGTARPQLPAETVTVTRGQQSTGSGLGGTTGDPIIINGETSAPEAQITIAHSTPGTTVHCEVQEIVGASSTGAVSQYDTNPVTASLGLAGENEKLYKVKYHTDGTGYTPTSTTIKYYKVLKCHRVTFNANGGTFLSGSTLSVLVPHNTQAAAPSTPPTKTGYHIDGWYTEAACTTQWNFATQITEDKQLYAKWTPNGNTPYKVEHYQELPTATAGQYPPSPADTDKLTGTTGDTITVTQKSYQGFEFDKQEPASATIAADGNTVVKVYYKRKTVTVTFNPGGGTISGSPANVTVTGRFGTTLTPPTPVKPNYTFNAWSPAIPSPPVFPASDTTYTAQWHKNPKVTFKVYNGTGGSLKGTYGSSTQTAGNPPAILEPYFIVTYGGSISFEALPALAWEVDSWTGLTASPANAATATLSNITLDTTVIVKFKKKTTVNSTDTNPWEILREAVRIADNNAVITVNGEIMATNATGNFGKIDIDKNITIQGGSGADSDILNANRDSLGSNAHHVFTVSNGKTLILKNLTLKGGKGISGTFGGAVLVTVYGSKAQLTDCVIDDCIADKGGAIGCGKDTTVNLTRTTIKNCKATNSSAGNGGGICASGATVNITNCTIKGNTARAAGGSGGGGGAIYSEKTGSTASAVTIKGGTIGGTGTNDANVAKNLGSGGAIYIGEGCTLTMQDNAELIGNEAASSGGGICASGATVNITNCTIKGNTARAAGGSGGGGAIYAGKTGSTASAVTIKGGTIGGTGTNDANKAENLGIGGAICIGEGCTLNLGGSPAEGVQLIGNNADESGGGIFAYSATVNITNCTLKSNTAKRGGAIHVQKTGSTPSTVTIKGNTTIGGTGPNDANNATGDGTYEGGGGIWVGQACNLTLQDSVKVIGNKATKKGKGINAINTVVCIKDSVEVDQNNDVYLDYGSKIRADSALTPPSNKAARITVPDGQYQTTTQVLIAVTSVNLANEAGKFSVTPKGSQTWSVGSNGYLKTP